MSFVKKFVLGFVAGVLIGSVIGVGAWLAKSYFHGGFGSSSVSSSYYNGSLVPLNTTPATFKGQSIRGATVNQHSLPYAGDAEAGREAVFIFGTKPGDGVKLSPKRVDVFIDFASQKSRDFFLYNSQMFRELVETGKIVLYVHPVPVGDAYSMYAAQTVADAFAHAPSTAWGVLIQLLKNGATLDTNKPDDVVKVAVDSAHAGGFVKESARSVKSGSFASWILAVGDNKKLHDGFAPPLMFVDNVLVNPDRVVYNNVDEVSKAIRGE